MILFGFGQTTIIVTVVLFAIWIIVLDTRAGVRTSRPSLVEMARSLRRHVRCRLYGKIYVWAALPEILAGIRLGVIRGVKGVVIGQLLVSIVGFGELFELYSRSFLMEHFWALLFLLFAFAFPLNEALAWLERRVEYYAASRIGFLLRQPALDVLAQLRAKVCHDPQEPLVGPGGSWVKNSITPARFRPL